MSDDDDSLATICGPLLIGYLLNTMLYGILLVQVYLYYLSFPKDPALAKSLVIALFILETVQTALALNDAFAYYAVGFGNLSGMGAVRLNWLTVPVMTGLVSTPVQLYFANRIRLLSKSLVAPITISIISLIQYSAAMVAGAQAFQAGDFADMQKKTYIAYSLWLSGSATADIMIVVAMTYYLWQHDTMFEATNILVAKIIRITFETGILTAAVVSLDFILFTAFHSYSYHGTTCLILAKVYSNSCLAILNRRIHIAGGRDAEMTLTLAETEHSSSTTVNVKSGVRMSRFIDPNVSGIRPMGVYGASAISVI